MDIMVIIKSCKRSFLSSSSPKPLGFLGRLLPKFPLLSALASGLFAFGAMAATPNFVQSNSTVPQTPQTKVTLAYPAAQSAGNFNVVIVGWNDASAQVSSLTDSKGNLYHLAVGPTVLTGSAPFSQAVYYAKNISAAIAGANTVTLSFNSAAVCPDIRILEYSGVDPLNPLDVSAGATGNSATSNSGAVITTNAMDLLVGANMVWTQTTGPGSGFTQRLITNPDGDIAQDRVVTALGSYSASAPLTSAGPWMMHIVAFRAAGSPAPTPTPTSNLLRRPPPRPPPQLSPLSKATIRPLSPLWRR